MFAEREEVDVLHDDHLRVVFFEERIGKYLVGIHFITAREHLHGLGHAYRRLQQAFTLSVLTQQREYLLVM